MTRATTRTAPRSRLARVMASRMSGPVDSRLDRNRCRRRRNAQRLSVRTTRSSQGMTCAPGRRLLPGAPYPPGLCGPPEAQQIEGGWWKQGEYFRCVPRYLTCSTPPWRLSALLTTGNITTQILMLCMLQIRDGARWRQAIPPNMGPSETFSWVAQSHPSPNGHYTKISD